MSVEQIPRRQTDRRVRLRGQRVEKLTHEPAKVLHLFSFGRVDATGRGGRREPGIARSRIVCDSGNGDQPGRVITH